MPVDLFFEFNFALSAEFLDRVFEFFKIIIRYPVLGNEFVKNRLSPFVAVTRDVTGIESKVLLIVF